MKKSDARTSNPLSVFDEVDSTHDEARDELLDPSEMMAEVYEEDHAGAHQGSHDEYDDEYLDEYDDDYEEDPDADGNDPGHADADAVLATSGGAVTKLVYGLGAILTLGGIGLIALWNTGSAGDGVRELFSKSGLEPFDLVLLGLVLAGLAGIRQHLHRTETSTVQNRLRRDAALTGQILTQIQDLADSIQGSVQGQSPQELHKALHLIKRQDAKINNLSKATKMYGKPLLEISNQISESSHHISEISSRVDAVKVIAEQSSNRLETTLRGELRKLEALDTDKIERSVQAIHDTVKSLETLQRDLSQRLTEKTDKLATDIATANRDWSKGLETLKNDLEEGQGKLREALAEGVKKLDKRGGQAGPGAPELGGKLGELEGKLDRLTAAVSKIAAQPVAAAPPPAAAAATPAAPATDGGTSAPDEPGGKPEGGSKSVLSAIQKLKQMRT